MCGISSIVAESATVAMAVWLPWLKNKENPFKSFMLLRAICHLPWRQLQTGSSVSGTPHYNVRVGLFFIQINLLLF